MSRYTSATDADRQEMLEAIGVDTIDDLFADVPEGVRLGRALDLPPGKPEQEVYARLRDLAAEMHAANREHKLLDNIDAAFSNLPEPVLTPRDTFARLVHREVEQVPAAQLEGRISAVQVVPYPPGIPLLMPGERFDETTRGVGDFLLGLEAFDARFPGFGHHIHGVEVKTDESNRPYYSLYCLRN